MKIIPLTATDIHIDVRNNFVIYATDVESNKPGIIVLADDSALHSMAIVNQVHDGLTPEVEVSMRPFQVPAKRYEVGEVIANLIVFE